MRARSRSPAGRGGRRGRPLGVDALGHQPVGHDAGGQGGHLDPHAPAGDGDQLGHDLGGQQHEHRRRRRLLDGLEQVAGGLVLHVLAAVGDDHLAGALDRRQRGVRTTRSASLLRNVLPSGSTSRRSGCCSGQGQAHVALTVVVGGAGRQQEPAAKARASACLPDPGGPTSR